MLSNDLFVLEFEELRLFLEISDDLAKGFFEQLNFGFHKFDFTRFFKLFLRVLLNCKRLRLQLVVENFIFLGDCINFFAEIIKILFLHQFFVFQSLILSLDIALYLTDVLFSFLLGIFLSLFVKLSRQVHVSEFLTFQVLFALLLDFCQLAKEHLVTLFLVGDLRFLLFGGVLEFIDQLLLHR